MPHSHDRRTFLRRAGAALAAPAIVPASALVCGRRAPPSERIGLAFVGVGTRGSRLLSGFLGRADVQVIGVTDVWRHRIDVAVDRVEQQYAEEMKSGSYRGCVGAMDEAALLARPDVDGVVIGTPDHWHAVQCLNAIRAGKDVYSEKPLTRTIDEARRLIAAARRAGTVFQTGSQQRSHPAFRTAVELIRSGRLGKVRTIRVNVGAPAQRCNLPAQPTPDSLAWDRWLGPAQSRPYHDILCPQRDGTYPRWRHYREFAGGGLADMGAHHFDIAQWALDRDASGPIEIVPPSGPEETGLTYVFDDGVRMIHEPGCVDGSGLVFECERGNLTAVRWHYSVDPPELAESLPPAHAVDIVRSDDHLGNWLDCMRTRERPVADVEAGARTSVLCKLGNLGYELRRPLQWDPVELRFRNDSNADRLTTESDRGGYAG